MLSSLIVLSVLLGPKSPGGVQNPQFPKPTLETPEALQDSTIFKYLSAEDKTKQWKPLEVGRDWSNLDVPAIKPDAVKLKVLLAVAERDFSNREFSNTLESRDKTRLLEAMARLKSLFAIVSDGGVSFEYVPRFIPEPIYDVREFKQLINSEFNRSKFESDDSIERGPFGAVLAISSSHVNDQMEPGDDFAVHGFSDLGGTGADMWFEEALFYVVQSEIFSRISNHYPGFKAGITAQDPKTNLMDRLFSMRGEYQRFFDPNFRQDGDLLAKWGQQTFHQLGRPFKAPEMAAIQSPANVSTMDGVLTYSEMSIQRAGELALPPSDKWATQKSLKFDVRTKGKNPLAVKLWLKDGSKREQVIGFEPGMITMAADNAWTPVSISFQGQDVIGATIGVPTNAHGKTRLKSEVVQFDLQNVDLSAEAGTPPIALIPPAPGLDTEQSIKDVLASGSKPAKRLALSNIEAIKGMKGLESVLLAATGELDAGVAHDATIAYFELILSGTPTPDQLTSLGKFLISPPNEAAREVALLYTVKNASYAKFDAVVGNTVRDNWRVRRAAEIALGALYRANVREKEGCHQMLLSSTSQEMALMRLAAISQLNPAISLDNQRLEFLMINDPCESVRLACLKMLAASNSLPKEKLLGCLADDSPSLRERVAVTLGAQSPVLRDALQKMVVDQDPYVRVAALKNFAVIGNVKEGEIQNVFTDKHPSVQVALLQGAKLGAWKIPADALAQLQASPIPAIKALAMEVK